jgi:uncharacterized protein YraI
LKHTAIDSGRSASAFRVSPRPSWARGGIFRTVTLLAIFAIAFGGLISTPSPARAASLTATDAVNLRSGPGTNYGVIRVIPEGAAVEVTGAAEAGFYPVTYNGSSGYASADYLSSGGGGNTSSGGPTGTRYVTGGALNFRSGPSTGDSVIGVLPNGAAVQLTGEQANGFARVTYNGRSGWAFAAYLGTNGGNAGGDTSGGGTAVGDSVTGSARVDSGALNLRRGPGTSYGVILVMPGGASVELMGSAQGGFYPIRYNGTKGWASADYLTPGGTSGGNTSGGDSGSGSVAIGDSVTGRATVVDGRLNLRRGPGTSYAVISVMPNGASVELMGSARSGFYPVRYNGTKGWASADYLRTGGAAEQPDPEEETPSGTGSVSVGNTVTDTKVTTAALNLRQGPGSSYGVVIVLPPGTQVDIMGSANGSYLPVRWAGRTGWAHGDWLTDPGSAPTPDDDDAASSDIVQIIYDAADRWGQPRADMLRVARCESNLNPRAVNSSSGASGLFQFMPSTFAFTPNGKAGQDIFDPYASADAAGWMWANGMRNHWACQ